MTWLRAAPALAVAWGISVSGASAQWSELAHAPPEAPAAYRAQNRVTAPEPAAHETPPLEELPAAPAIVDTAARFRDSFFGGLLGYGALAGIGALLGLVDGQYGGTEERQAISIALLAPLGVSFGVWLGGLVNGGSRLDGAFVGTTVGALLGALLIVLIGGPSPEDPAAWSIGLLAPVIGSIAGAEIASAIGGVRF